MIIVDPQRERRVLQKIVARTLEDDELDVSASAEWVLQNVAAEARVRSIREAWGLSSLPVAKWKDDVSRVDVVTSEEWLGLELKVHLSNGQVVTQEPPVSSSRLSELRRIAPCLLPPIIVDLLLSAPGLSLMPRTCLTKPGFLIRPLFHQEYYIKVSDPDEVVQYGYEVLDPRLHAIEVADIALDYYILGKDGTLYYFDEKVIAGLTPCSISLDQLFDVYFKNPILLTAPYEHGFAQFPEAAKTFVEKPPTLVEDLGDRPSKLTNLGLLSLGVRNCRRALPEGCRIEVPDNWDAVIDVLREIIKAAEQVCTTGVAMSGRIAAEMAEQARDSTTILLSLSDEAIIGKNVVVTSSYLGHMLGQAVTELARMTAMEHLPRTSMAYQAAPVIQNIPVTHKAAIWDAEVLLGLELGAPGTPGVRVPAGFFVRPLWPNECEP